jgi:beta-lactam-binding protein with PASTA domain
MWHYAPEPMRGLRRELGLLVIVGAALAACSSPSTAPPKSTSSSVLQSAGSGPAVVYVPALVGMTQIKASETLGSAGLSVGAITLSTSATYSAGMVIAQQPAAGSRMQKGSTVILTVSKGSASP